VPLRNHACAFCGKRLLQQQSNDAHRQTAKEAFAKAIEWHVVQKFSDISISDDRKTYTIAEFSLTMALHEISRTMDGER
jgi:phosphopantetheinyl transferase (holo-ACP synthase)